MPGSWSLSHDWRPPFVCFSDEPILAWTLSGRLYPEIKQWDLWMVFASDVGDFEVILEMSRHTGKHYVKEYRVYHRIYKRDVYYIASRSV